MNKNMQVLERYESKYLDPAWDNKILNYDQEKFNWSQIFLESIQEKFPSVTNMEELHLHLKTPQLLDLRKHLEAMSVSKWFGQKIDEFFETYITAILPGSDYMIQKTPGIRLLVPDQEKKGRLLTFHTGHWTGYNNGIYTVWTPVTRTWGSNAMQVIDWEDTKDIMTQIHNQRLPIEQVQALCKEKCWPTTINVGQSWLFNQGHLHGNINNDTGITRISFDTRAMMKGTDYGFRYPGGFYRLRNEDNTFEIKNIDPGLRWIVFTDQGSDYVGATPQFIIREFLLSWAKRHNIVPLEWTNEYLHCDWNLNLRFLINNGITQGLVLPSIYAFTSEPLERLEIMQLAVENNIVIAFADENILVNSKESLDYVRKIYSFAYPDLF